jgi:oxygen-independent coproporphyrinogen-3 oxidase
VNAIHWGGGTPSMLGPDTLIALTDRLAGAFNCAPAEHAIELDPRHVTVELADGLAELGITRASLGVQDVNPLVQVAIGRLQPLAMIEAAVARVRGAGIHNLNFDLIYGLPLQTAESIRKTCAHVVSMEPDRIACFGYAHLPRLKANQRRIDESKLPSQDERIEQADAMAEALVAAGYERIGIDHFAKPGDSLACAAASGRLHRNFQGYTSDRAETLIGLGASAIGRLPAGYVQNAVATGEYERRMRTRGLATAKGRALTADDRVRGFAIERLMCDLRFPATELDQRFGPAAAPVLAEARAIVASDSEGLVTAEDDAGGFRVTEKGRIFVRSIAACFDAYLGQGQARHSAGV